MLTADWKLIRIGLGSTYDVLWVLQDVLEGLGPVTALGDAISIYKSAISVGWLAIHGMRCSYVPDVPRGSW